MSKIIFCILLLGITPALKAGARCLDNLVFCGELLYLKPTIEQGSYVISSSLNREGDEFFPNGRRHFHNSPFKPGYRLEGLYLLCGRQHSFDVRFTYFHSIPEDSVSGPFLFDTIGFPGEGAQAPEDTSYNGTAHIRNDYLYYAVDAVFNRLSLTSCFDNLHLLTGLHYANIEYGTNFTSNGTFETDEDDRVANVLRRKSRFWAIGPQLGVHYRYNLFCGCNIFSLVASSRGALLCSNTHASLHYNTLRTVPTAGINLDNDHQWRVNPMMDARLGFRYQRCCKRFEWALEAGYEWIWYSDAIDTITGLDVGFPGDTLDVFNNFSLQGPYLRLCVGF